MLGWVGEGGGGCWVVVVGGWVWGEGNERVSYSLFFAVLGSLLLACVRCAGQHIFWRLAQPPHGLTRARFLSLRMRHASMQQLCTRPALCSQHMRTPHKCVHFFPPACCAAKALEQYKESIASNDALAAFYATIEQIDEVGLGPLFLFVL